MNLIVAIAENGVIGKNNSLPWPKLKEDMLLFKQLTTGNAVVMGRKTWDSIPEKFRPLPDRTNIVVSSTLVSDQCKVVKTLADVNLPNAFIIGGRQIYEEAIKLGLIDKMFVSWVKGSFDGDVHFPDIDWVDWNEIKCQEYNGFIACEYARMST